MFDCRYEVIQADTEAAKAIHYQVRCEIYCVDREFESVDQFPDGQERDEADDNAVHFLVREKASGEWVATMRMVLPHDIELPIEIHCKKTRSFTNMVPRSEIAEVSRVGILRKAKQNSVTVGDTTVDQSGDTPGDTTRPNRTRVNKTRSAHNQSEILLALLRASWAYSKTSGIRYLFFFVTPAFSRLLPRVSLSFEPAGLACSHRGNRNPYMSDVNLAADQLKNASPEMAAFWQYPSPYTLYSA